MAARVTQVPSARIPSLPFLEPSCEPDRQANVRMKLLILKAIYSKPELEAAVEKELREFI
jgi:hypothetical protein